MKKNSVVYCTFPNHRVLCRQFSTFLRSTFMVAANLQISTISEKDLNNQFLCVISIDQIAFECHMIFCFGEDSQSFD